MKKHSIGAWGIAVALLLVLGSSEARAQRFAGPVLKSLNATTGPSACHVLDVTGLGAGSVTITNTFSGTLAWTVSPDGGTYTSVTGSTPLGTTATNTTTTGQWSVSVASWNYLRVCFTAYSSGTADVVLSASGAGGLSVGGGGAVEISGDALTALQSIATDIDTLVTGLSDPAVHGDVVGSAPDLIPVAIEAKDLDGAAPPNLVDEGDFARPAATLAGSAWAFLTNEAGTATPTVDHDAVDQAATMAVGFRAIAFGANPTAVAAADRTAGYANRAGVPFVLGGHPNTITREAQIEDADGAQTNAAIVTVSAGTKIVVTQVGAHCDGSTTAPTNIVVGFGTATLAARAAGGTSGILAGFDGVPAGGGMVKGNGAGVIGVGADDEDIRITTEDPAGGACSVEVSYFTIES